MIKKIKKWLILWLAAAAVFLSSCSPDQVKELIWPEDTIQEEEFPLQEEAARTPDTEEGTAGPEDPKKTEQGTEENRQVIPANEEDDDTVRAAVGLSDEQIVELGKTQMGKYHYDRISEAEKRLYVELYQIMIMRGEDIRVSTMDTDEIARVFQCVLNDHPEIFYVEGYTFTKYTLGEELKKLTFTATYSMDEAETDQNQSQIDAYVKDCLSGIPEGADEYEKVKYIYEYIINHTDYNALAEENQNICSVFLYGQSVCQGYAKAMQYLLNQMKVYSTLVIGRVSPGEGHAWILVRIDGDYYYVDPTWGDASYQIEGLDKEGADSENLPTINYDYLCVTTKQLLLTHTIEPVVNLPECTSMEANYYVREGAYFTSVDKESLKSLFDREYEKGSSYVTLKCSSVEVFREMEQRLIDEQEIFRYLKSPDGVVKYADNEEQLSLSFWL